MMKFTKKEARQSSLIHEKIKASFVPSEDGDTKKFKYNFNLRNSKYFNDKFIRLKTFYNKIIQTPPLWLGKIDFKKVKEDSSVWFIESLIEGFVINFIVWSLLGWRFNLLTLLAWGFAVKQSLDIYWRFKKHGPNTTIPTKD